MVDENAGLSLEELRDAWAILAPEDRVEGFELLPDAEAVEFFLDLPAAEQIDLVLALPIEKRGSWLRLLEPDDATDLIQEAPEQERDGLLASFDERSREELEVLLAYEEDDAGGLMSTRFVHVRADMTVDEAIRYLRKQAQARVENITYTYVLDAGQRLQGVMSFRELITAKGNSRIRDEMNTDVITVPEEMDQEEVGRVIAQHDLVAVPVVDAEGRMKGVVTIDDIVDVVEEEATEDIQKIGGMQALEAPYLQTTLGGMIKKRVGWLAVLMVGEMLTATAMARFEDEIAKAVVLAMFVPLIISSGGNAGSQASTLVIRAVALGEIRPHDWVKILWRELRVSFSMGVILAVLGVLRIVLWPTREEIYGEHWGLIAAVLGFSLAGIVTWGAVVGSMLPLALRRVGLDPASASAPFVATLVDVTGIIIYFEFAQLLLKGALL